LQLFIASKKPASAALVSIEKLSNSNRFEGKGQNKKGLAILPTPLKMAGATRIELATSSVPG